MKRSKKYAKIKSSKPDKMLYNNIDRITRDIIGTGKIKRLEIFQAVGIITNIPYEKILNKNLDKDEINKVYIELTYMLERFK